MSQHHAVLQRQVNKGVPAPWELAETDAEAGHRRAVSYVAHWRMVRKASGQLFSYLRELGEDLKMWVVRAVCS